MKLCKCGKWNSEHIECMDCKTLATREIKDMTVQEAIKFFGSKMWLKMRDTKLLTGVTCMRNDKGKLVVYACDLKNAYTCVMTCEIGFID